VLVSITVIPAVIQPGLYGFTYLKWRAGGIYGIKPPERRVSPVSLIKLKYHTHIYNPLRGALKVGVRDVWRPNPKEE
jgi:hypothetical protein